MADVFRALSNRFSITEQPSKHQLLDRVLTCGAQFGEPAHVFWVPGRIEVLGKHTDYGGGRSLLAATTRGFFFAVYPRKDDKIVVVDCELKEQFESRVAPDVAPRLGHWSNYAETVFRRVARNFEGDLKGANIAFASDLPQAAGMSSSSAMIVGFFLVLDAVNDLKKRDEYQENIRSAEDLAGYLGTNENGQTFGTLVGDKGVGTFGGSEDHTAILNCRSGHLSQYRYCPVAFEREMALPNQYVFVVAASGVIAEKTGAAMAKYNKVSRLAFEALGMWNDRSASNDPNLATAIERVGYETIRDCLATCSHSEFTSDELVERLDHFYTENEVILPGASDALANGDIALFGDWVQKSQVAGVEMLKNQVAETEALAVMARDKGAFAASAFGAGFGGSVWAFVERNRVEDFIGEWKQSYSLEFEDVAEKSAFFSVEAGPGAFSLSENLR